MSDDHACIDADTLAAWADDALDAAERRRVEAHAAECGRCQALLAAMIRTAPLVEVRSRWRMPALGWLVPLTAAAAALAIWVAVPRQEPLQRSETAETAAQREAEAAPSASGSGARPTEDAKPLAEAEPQRQLPKRRETDRVAEETAPLQKKVSPESPSRSVDALGDRADVAPPAGAPSSAPAAAPPASATSLKTTAALNESVSIPTNRIETVIVSSNPATRFRLLPGGGVQRSADGGATWRNEVTGATETLTAGSSPSPSVCWLVGPRGTIVLTTRGNTWRRIVFPEPVDLRSVVAADAENATVTTVDGRSFTTTDGGATWSPTPDF